MKHLFALLLSCIFTLSYFQSYSQGCSDAGVCTVGSLGLVQFKFNFLPHDENKLSTLSAEDPSLNPALTKRDSLNKQNNTNVATVSSADSANRKKPLSAELNYIYPKYFFQYTSSYGLSDQKTSIITTQVEGNFRLINKKLFAQIKLPYVFVNGKLGSVNGLGDVTLSLSYIAFTKTQSSLSMSGGVKIPTNNSNFSINNLPLPMVYQSSLGSTDILLGLKYTIKKWDFTIGYQHSLNQNKNGYIHNSFVSDTATYNSYFEAKNLRRSDDGVFRINRNFVGKKINVSGGVLLIYHMANDTYTNGDDIRVQSVGSKGLTLNLNLAGIIPLSKKLDFIFIVAKPLIIRDARPDGLTRAFVGIIGLKYNIF